MAEVDASVSRDSGLGITSRLLQSREVGAILAVLVLFTLGSFIRADVFLSADNLVGIIRNTAITAIIGYGMTLLMVSGEFDLSVGSLMAVCAALVATMYGSGYPILFIVLLVLFFAAIYGLFQGLMITKLGLPSLIVTIGTLTLLRGANLVILGGQTATIPSDNFPRLLFYIGGVLDLGTDAFLVSRFPLQIVWTLLFLVLGYYILNKTAFGYRAMFTGGNKESANRTGIKTDHVKIINFMLVALLAAFAGMGQLAFTQAVSPSTGQGVELIVIASVVIGGTNLFGGEGSMPGTFLGALVFALTQNILVLAGLGVQLFQVFTGIFIIAAVLIEVLSRDLRLEYLTEEYLSPLKSLSTETESFFEYVRGDVQGIDEPLIFAAVGTVIWAVATLILMTVVDTILGWEFSFVIVSPGVSALGTVPLIAFLLTAGLLLLTAIFLHASVKALGTRRDFDTTLQGVIYSFAPAVLLFVPVLLIGWSFVTPLVLGSVVLIAAPILYLLYQSTRVLHEFSSRNALLAVGATIVLWLAVGVFTATQIGIVG
ncbi:ABC transporter permease [Haloarcula nitratireducens]|uniref:ABC transporter permease n=1 Tax=Haloarcula nitratireducens TaxID=2487749 RepID=A0AAW4PG67_9EURY|nr:ABC transporter permease [Halomicroarcula nitratireducens]MBX0296873.1 ABC transporter permease [Halomicroarcula nitratireducens]